MHPLEYSRFQYYHIDPDDLDSVPPAPNPALGGGPWRMVSIGIDEPACQMVYEDFFPGHEYSWSMWIDMVDFGIEGKCEITCVLPPALEETVTVVVEAPCVYLVPRGSRITWKPLGEGPFRHLSVDIPNPGFPVDLVAASVQRAALAAAAEEG